MLLRCFVLAFLLIHGAALGLSRVRPSVNTDQVAIYFANQRLLVGILLSAWLVGFNLISWAIWLQFEAHESVPIDDYDVTDDLDNHPQGMVENNEQGKSALGSRSEGTMIVRMPSGELSLGSVNQ